MSYYGRKAVAFDLERRWTEGHRAGTLHRWERTRILSGDYRAIVRELEPEFEEGQEIVLSKTRPRGALILDRATGVEILYPKGQPQPLFMITIRDVRRHRLGHWRVIFDTYDGREADLYVRSKPPVYALGEEETEDPDDEQVQIDSAFTSNPDQALDYLSYPRDYDNVIQMQSRDRAADFKRQERAEQQAREDAKRLAATVRDTLLMMARNGVDSSEYLAGIQRAAQRVEEQEAA